MPDFVTNSIVSNPIVVRVRSPFSSGSSSFSAVPDESFLMRLHLTHKNEIVSDESQGTGTSPQNQRYQAGFFKP